MESENQNPIPEPVQPVSQAPTNPIKTSNLPVLLLSISLIIAISFAGIFFFQTQKLSKELAKYQSATPVPSATPIATNECVEKSSLDCTNEPELSFECTSEYQVWAVANCPGWEERIDCTNPRPEVCTMECAEPPPYICGSDGKSYCSTCQACSKKNILWYEMKNSPCGEN